MPLADGVIEGLPERVVNELAILEDRALRAEAQLQVKANRMSELEAEVGALRNEMLALVALAGELQGKAQATAEAASADVKRIEEELRHLLVLQAS